MTSSEQQQPLLDQGRPPASPSNGLGIASLVCGIIGIVAAVLVALFGTIIGVLAIVLGAVSRRQGGRTNLATAGLVTGVVAVVIGIANSIFGALLFSGKL